MNVISEKPVKTTCPYCGVGCGVIATPKPDGTIKIDGDPDHPANFGRLCSKGSALGETVGLEGRLLEPEIQGKTTDWDTALDHVAKRFSAAVRDHGPDSVAFYVSGQILTEDYYVANKLMKGFIGSANIDTNSRLCMASSVAGHRKAFGADTVPGTYEDLELADLVVLVGSNLAWCHPVLYQRIEAAKQARPKMKVVLVDPRRTMTASIADYHLAIEPDGDAALFCGLLAHLEEIGALNTAYIEAHTNGFDAALAAAKSLTIEALLQQTGLKAQELETFYSLFASTEKTVTVYSQGVNQSVSGTDKVSSILNCHLATGRIGKPGMGPFSVTGQPNAMGGREVGGLANMLTCHMDLENPQHRSLVKAFWDAPAMPQQAGLKAIDMFKAVADGKIKALWIMSTNPVDSLPEADSVKAALEACPFVVVSDILEDTDTMRFAHVKLPATAWGEKDGTVTNSERRISRQRAFMPWPRNTRPDWWQMAEVGKRMGFSHAFSFSGPEQIFDEYARLSASENGGTRDFDIGGLSGMTAEEYLAFQPIQWPMADGQSKKETRFFSNGGFFTPDRKARFVPVKPAKPVVTTQTYPFVLNTGRVRDHWHTMTRTARSARLSAHMAEPYCEIHPDDAEKIGVSAAGLVKLRSDHGSVLVRALLSTNVKLGSVFVPMHWTDQYASNGRIDALVPARLDPFSGQPASKNVAVAIELFEAAAYGFLVSREKPDFKDGRIDYWATAPCSHGWRTEFAFARLSDAVRFSETLECQPGSDIDMFYNDPTCAGHRRAVFRGDQLQTVLYLSHEPVLVAREWLVECLLQRFPTNAARMAVLAGRPNADQPDKGAMICSCMQVGSTEILGAIHSGNTSVQTVGKITNAGTNCGSCRAEINGMINGYLQETKIAAE